IGISMPATNQGQGSLSQSFMLYTFGNSTSLATYLTASRAVSWTTGTSSAGSPSTRQQGWASNNIQPFTFASTSISAGEYAVAHLASWAAQSTSWTISVYGQTAGTSSSYGGYSAALQSAGVLSSGGLLAGSVMTGSTAAN